MKRRVLLAAIPAFAILPAFGSFALAKPKDPCPRLTRALRLLARGQQVTDDALDDDSEDE